MATHAEASLITAEGKQTLTARIEIPIWGAWTASLEVDADAPPAVGELVTIIVATQRKPSATATMTAAQRAALTAQVFMGTVVWGKGWQGRSRYEVVGGTGGLDKVRDFRGYAQGPVPLLLGDIIADLVADAGETLAPGVHSTLAVAPYTLPRWPRCRGKGSASLTRLCRLFGLCWRVLDDGTIWVGIPTYPQDVLTEGKSPTMVATDPGDEGQQRVITLAPDSATLRPDTTIFGRKCIRVVYGLSLEGLRAEVYYPADDGLTDRDDLEHGIRTMLPELPYLPGYAATITGIRNNGRVEVRTDDETFNSPTGAVDGVELLSGLPEARIQPALGQRVRLYFSAADPRLSYAVAWEQDEAATRGVARVGDTTASGTISVSAPPGGGPCTITLTPPGGGTASVGPSVDLAGIITSGHPRIKLTPAT